MKTSKTGVALLLVLLLSGCDQMAEKCASLEYDQDKLGALQAKVQMQEMQKFFGGKVDAKASAEVADKLKTLEQQVQAYSPDFKEQCHKLRLQGQYKRGP